MKSVTEVGSFDQITVANYLEFKEAREQVDKKYQQMGYDRARKLIKYFSEAEVITFTDRTKLSEYLSTIYKIDQDKKREKRIANKLKKKNDIVSLKFNCR